MIETTSTWGLQIPGVSLELLDYADQGDMEYAPGIFNVLNSAKMQKGKKNYEGKTGFAGGGEFDEGESLPEVKRDKTYLTEVTDKNYGGIVSMSQNLIDDNDYQGELDAFKDHVRNINYQKDESGLQLFNGGFATTTSVNGYTVTWYGDGVPQFSTVHPTKSAYGSTQSNASANGIVFNHDNYHTAQLAVDKQQTDNAKAVTMAGKKTVVAPTDLKKKIMETFDSDLTPESANNAINVFRGNADVAISKFLDSNNGGSTTAWFITVAGTHSLYNHMRQETLLDQDKEIRTNTHTFSAYARWINFSRGWVGSWGTKGDGNAYSS